MSAKKGRKAKVPTVSQDESQKAASLDNMDSPNLSCIDKASFLDGLQQNFGNPLHSTAMEEDLNALEEGQVDRDRAGKADVPQMLTTAAKQRGAAVKPRETDAEKKKTRRSVGGKVKARPEAEGGTKKKKEAPWGEREELDAQRKEPDPSATVQKSLKPNPTASKVKGLVGKKPANGASAGHTSTARPEKHQQMKTSKRGESDSQSQEASDTGTAPMRRKRLPSSDEELIDEDSSWNPSPKKARMSRLSRTRKSLSDRSESRKSSSGSASAEAEKASRDKQKRKRQSGTELEVVLDAFLDFCEQYRESVESNAVQQSIDSFSSNVKEQLLEKISSYKKLKVLSRENAKLGSLIRTKRQRLLDAKHELMRAERQEWLLQKEEAELKLRLADLRRGQAFLHDISELNRQYLDFRRKHPKEKETYGASSLPALLLETKHNQAAEHQLRGSNDGMDKRVGKNGTQK